MRGRGYTSTPTLAGLPRTERNPAYNKDIFNMYIPKFQEFIDGMNGKIETIKNELTEPVMISLAKVLEFKNIIMSKDKTTLNINGNKDIILGKRTSSCYREGYSLNAIGVFNNSLQEDSEVILEVYLNDELIAQQEFISIANDQTEVELDRIIVNPKLNSVLTFQILAENEIQLNSFDVTVKTRFEAARGNGAILYENFCNIAHEKILKSVWNIDWEFAMSLCIAHYVALINRETQVSFGLEDIAKDSDPRGITTATIDKTKYDFKDIMIDHNQAKFWNSTEYGRQLIALLYTKAIPTMISVN